MRSHKVIVAIARRAYCFYFYLYIAPLLLLWDLSTLCLYMTVSLQCLFKDSWQLCQLRLSSSSLVLCLVSWYRGDNWKSKTSQWNAHCKQFFTNFELHVCESKELELLFTNCADFLQEWLKSAIRLIYQRHVPTKITVSLVPSNLEVCLVPCQTSIMKHFCENG